MRTLQRLLLGLLLWASLPTAASENVALASAGGNRRALKGAEAKQGRRYNFKGDTWIAHGQVKHCDRSFTIVEILQFIHQFATENKK